MKKADGVAPARSFFIRSVLPPAAVSRFVGYLWAHGPPLWLFLPLKAHFLFFAFFIFCLLSEDV
jgi:hypothetical protein